MVVEIDDLRHAFELLSGFWILLLGIHGGDFFFFYEFSNN